MIKDKFDPAFPLKHQQKDMRLALALGDEVGVSMPIAAASNEVIYKCIMFMILFYSEKISITLTSLLVKNTSIIL